MNKIILITVLFLFTLTNCQGVRKVADAEESNPKSEDDDMVVALYEHVDSITGEVSLLPFDSLYPAEQEKIYKADSDPNYSELDAVTDPIWFVRFDSIAVKDSRLSEINAIYGKPKETYIDTLRFGIGTDGMEYDDGYIDGREFRNTPFVIIMRKVWVIDSNHNLELYFKYDVDEDIVPFDGWLGNKWDE